MEPVKPSSVSSKKSKIARAFAKVLHIQMLTGASPVSGIQKLDPVLAKSARDGGGSDSFGFSDEEQHERASMEALLAKLFANISALKAAYAQLQYSQSPFDAAGIQAADQTIVSELRSLSELKQCFVKKQFDPSPETAMVAAEILEQKGILKIYEISLKKLNSQVRLKDSEIIFLEEKLEEAKNSNKLLEKRLSQLSDSNSDHFPHVLQHTVKTTRKFVGVLIDEMKSAGWDIDTAASVIEPNAAYWKEDHKCFAFEAFVCRVMFEGFNARNFALPNESLRDNPKQPQPQQKQYLSRFTELRSMKAKDFLSHKPKSAFSKFCRVKYLQLIHPKMESSFFGNLSQRSLVNSGQIPQTAFYATFAEMAKWVWLLHCSAFASEPGASVFRVDNGCRFAEVYMRSVTEEIFFIPMDSDPQVSFTVIPGFTIGKTVIQCQVYISQPQVNSGKQR